MLVVQIVDDHRDDAAFTRTKSGRHIDRNISQRFGNLLDFCAGFLGKPSIITQCGDIVLMVNPLLGYILHSNA
jgi:hypothetical protein